MNIDSQLILSRMRAHPSLPEQADFAEKLLREEGKSLSQTSPKPIRTVGVFYYRASRGGTERVMANLLRMWDRMGYRTVLFTDFPAGEDDEPLLASTKRFILPDTFLLNARTRVERYNTLQQLLKQEQVDCFVHHAWLSANLLWDLLAVKTLNIPFILYTHSAPSCLLTDEDPKNMDELPHLTKIFPLADRVICLSHTFAAFWRQFTPKISLFQNPCGIPPAGPRSNLVNPVSPTLLWAGRFSPEKQPEEAIKIFGEIAKSLPSTRLVMLGSGGETYRDLENALKETVKKQNLENRVLFPGFITDPTPWYKQADLLLLTSKYEGFGLVIAESKAHGIPAVLYDLPYLYFTEEKKGLITVPQSDAEAAAKAAASLLTQPEEYQKFSREAFESSREFRPEALKDKWQELFQSLELPSSSAAPKLSETARATRMLLDHLHAGLETVQKKSAEADKNAAGGLLNSIFDPTYYAEAHPDLRAAFGNDPLALLRHYLDCGMAEGRQASPLFNPKSYATRYPDLKAAYGEDWKALALHFLLYGRRENRSGK